MKLPHLRWPDIVAPASNVNQPLGKRLLWMGGIWLASTGSLLLLALVIRTVLRS